MIGCSYNNFLEIKYLVEKEDWNVEKVRVQNILIQKQSQIWKPALFFYLQFVED